MFGGRLKPDSGPLGLVEPARRLSAGSARVGDASTAGLLINGAEIRRSTGSWAGKLDGATTDAAAKAAFAASSSSDLLLASSTAFRSAAIDCNFSSGGSSEKLISSVYSSISALPFESSFASGGSAQIAPSCPS